MSRRRSSDRETVRRHGYMSRGMFVRIDWLNDGFLNVDPISKERMAVTDERVTITIERDTDSRPAKAAM